MLVVRQSYIALVINGYYFTPFSLQRRSLLNKNTTVLKIHVPTKFLPLPL